MTTPQEIYDLPLDQHKAIYKSFSDLILSECSHGHLATLDAGPYLEFNWCDYEFEYNTLPNVKDDRVELRVIERLEIDARRYYQMASVWFDGQPVMVTQNAGRRGDDWKRHWITDFSRYEALSLYVRDQLMLILKPKLKDPETVVITAPDTPVAELDVYYQHRRGANERWRSTW